MSHSLTKKITLRENERVIKIVRSHPLTYLWQIFFTIILFALPFFFLYPLLQKELLGIITFCFLIILGLIFGSRLFVLWYFNTWIITNLKVIDVDQRGIFDRRVSEIPLEKIKDVSFRTKGIVATVFKLGEIEILTTDDKLSFILRKVSQPQEVQRLISNLQVERIERELEGKNLSAQELIKLVQKIKRGLGEEKFRELVTSKDE